MITRTISHPSPASGPAGRAARVPWWRVPFTADTWKRTLYALVALPVGLGGLVLALVGGGAAAGRFQRRLARGLLGVEIDPPQRAGRGVIAHGLAGLPPNLAALAVAVYGWSLVPMNTVLFPFRAGDPPLTGSWGGPTLAGAWSLHAAAGLAFLFLVPWAVRGMTTLQGGLARRLLS